MAKTKKVDNIKEGIIAEKGVQIEAKQKKNIDEQNTADISLEKKLEFLYGLQIIDSKIDSIRIVRGELPLEVQDIEDDIAGLETRINNYKAEIIKSQSVIKEEKSKIDEANTLIKKYEDQRMNVRNNREYDSLSKEIEYQTLEIQLSEKKTNNSVATIAKLQEQVDKAIAVLNQKKEDLKIKRNELELIIKETISDEDKLIDLSKKHSNYIEERLLNAYKRIRANVRNGLAVVPIEREACAGCFSKIPPQRQLDIKTHKKIIVCESCGRILVDNEIVENVMQIIQAELK